MNNARSYVLGATNITVPVPAQALSAVINLDGMTAASLVAQFAYGSGGASVEALVQTSLDGVAWFDVARFDFGTVSATKIANLSALTPRGIVSAAPLGAEGVFDGFLGNELRLLYTVTGTYLNTTLTVRAAVR